MWPFIVFLIALAMGVFLWVGSARAETSPESKNSSPPLVVTAEQVSSMSRADLDAMLRKVEKATAPAPKMGAMCYAPLPPPQKAEYVCPACHEKTVYTNEVMHRVQDVEHCRTLIAAIRKNSKLNVALDEQSFCLKCNPREKAPFLSLVVTLDDGTRHRTEKIGSGDLSLLQAFLAGNLTLKTFNDGEFPMKDSLPRIRELLGLAEKK